MLKPWGPPRNALPGRGGPEVLCAAVGVVASAYAHGGASGLLREMEERRVEMIAEHNCFYQFMIAVRMYSDTSFIFSYGLRPTIQN